MKKISIIFALMMVLLASSGCSTIKSYKTEDFEVYDIISVLDEMKRDAEDEGVAVNYEVKREMNDKYTIKLVYEFDEHRLEMKSISFTMDEFRNGFDPEMTEDDIFTFKVDGVKYDYATAMVLAEHYSDGVFH